MHNDPVIKLEEAKTPDIDPNKFLEIIFNKKINIHLSLEIPKKQIPQSSIAPSAGAV